MSPSYLVMVMVLLLVEVTMGTSLTASRMIRSFLCYPKMEELCSLDKCMRERNLEEKDWEVPDNCCGCFGKCCLVKKMGHCPRVMNDPHSNCAQHQCLYDYDCAESQKCCWEGCDRVCKEALVHQDKDEHDEGFTSERGYNVKSKGSGLLSNQASMLLFALALVVSQSNA